MLASAARAPRTARDRSRDARADAGRARLPECGDRQAATRGGAARPACARGGDAGSDAATTSSGAAAPSTAMPCAHSPASSSSWMAQTAGDAWSQYLRESSACIRKLKGLDLGPEICGAGGCDPALRRLPQRHQPPSGRRPAVLRAGEQLHARLRATAARAGRDTSKPPSDASRRRTACRTARCPAGTTRRREA